MTQKQLKEKTTKELLTIYKSKARCVHSRRQSDSIFKELKKRIEDLTNLEIETWHIQNGESSSMFDEECDKLILNPMFSGKRVV